MSQGFSRKNPNLTHIIGGNTIGATANITSDVYMLAGGNNVTLSQNSNSVTILAGKTLSYYNPSENLVLVTGNQGNASLHIQPMQAPDVQFDRIVMPVFFSNSTASTVSMSASIWIAFYTRTASTLSLYASTSVSTTWVGSGTVNSASVAGIKLYTIGMTSTLSGAEYYVGINVRSSTGGNNGTFANLLISQQNSNFSGLFNVASNATAQITRGLGVYSASTTGIPSSIAFSQINGTSSLVMRPPVFYLLSQTY